MNKPKPLVPYWRRLLLFQSVRQGMHTFVIYLIVIFLVDSLLPSAKLYVALGAFTGIAYYLWCGFTHELCVQYAEVPAAFENVDHLLGRHFQSYAQRENEFWYRARRPRFLVWEEGTVKITRMPGGIRIVGPGTNLFWLYRQLTRIVPGYRTGSP